jgi:hypothetical protein
MNGLTRIVLFVTAGIVLALTPVFSDSIYSYQVGDKNQEEIPMEQYLKYSASGRLERATFALG